MGFSIAATVGPIGILCIRKIKSKKRQAPFQNGSHFFVVN
jgi:hypothetical protein